MAQINVKEGDYILIGEAVTIHFDYKTGRNEMVIAIDAPEEMTILGGKRYEESLADPHEYQRLTQERSAQRRKTYASRARRNKQEAANP